MNERDELGDNLPPDYITHVKEGGFYGWPWYYTGGNQDPRFPGKHPELKDKVDRARRPHGTARCLSATHFLRRETVPKGISADRSLRPSTDRGIARCERATKWFSSGEERPRQRRIPGFSHGLCYGEGRHLGPPSWSRGCAGGSLMVTDDGSNSIWRVTYAKK